MHLYSEHASIDADLQQTDSEQHTSILLVSQIKIAFDLSHPILQQRAAGSFGIPAASPLMTLDTASIKGRQVFLQQLILYFVL